MIFLRVLRVIVMVFSIGSGVISLKLLAIGVILFIGSFLGDMGYVTSERQMRRGARRHADHVLGKKEEQPTVSPEDFLRDLSNKS
jgi:hypothetical protein